MPQELQIPNLNIPSQESTVPDTSNTVTPPEMTDSNGLLNPFLNGIPEQDRPIVQKYVKDWDSGVTKRFQSLHDELNPYKELGDYDRVSKAMEIISIMEEDPQRFYEGLAQVIAELTGEEVNEGEDMSMNEEETQYEEEVDPRDAQIQALMEKVNQLDQNFSQTQQEKEDEKQMAELDNYMQQLHNEHGDFDDDWVLVQISRGIDPVEAVQKWNAKLEESVNSRRKVTPPTIMQGAGGVPGGQVDPSKFNPSQRKEYIASLLSNAANQ